MLVLVRWGEEEEAEEDKKRHWKPSTRRLGMFRVVSRDSLGAPFFFYVSRRISSSRIFEVKRVDESGSAIDGYYVIYNPLFFSICFPKLLKILASNLRVGVPSHNFTANE